MPVRVWERLLGEGERGLGQDWVGFLNCLCDFDSRIWNTWMGFVMAKLPVHNSRKSLIMQTYSSL